MKRPEELAQELQENAPWLAKMKNNPEGFQVPPGYFERLPDEVLAKLNLPATAPLPQPWWTNLAQALESLVQPRYALLVASLMVILVVGWWWQNQQHPQGDITAAQLNAEALQAYFQEQGHQLDAELLEEIATGSDASLLDLEPNDLGPAELDHYLDAMTDDLDPALLNELL